MRIEDLKRKDISAEEAEAVIKRISEFINLEVTPFGKDIRSIVQVDKRQPMYGGDGKVYLLHMFDKRELVNNRIGSYMILPDDGDESGFHTHGPRKEQELYIVMHGVGEYADRDGEHGTIRKQKISKGSVTAVQHNGFHAVKNIGNEPLIIFVVTTNEPN